MTIAEIEDAIIRTLIATGVFRSVQSIGRKDRPATLNYPSAFVLFVQDKNIESSPRPIFDAEFSIFVVNKNLSSSGHAAQTTYDLLDIVSNALHGKTLGLQGIGTFECLHRTLSNYESGEITYEITIGVRRYQPVPTE